MTPSSPWFVCPRPRASAKLRLVCFPYAGVGASIYARWQEHLPQDVEVWAVQLPGRESRLREAPIYSLHALARTIAAESAALLTEPFALFGHSMGAVLAYETACHLNATGKSAAHLFVSARRPPHVPDPDSPLRQLGDAAFIDAIGARYEPIPKPILEDAEILALVLPALRSDIAALETHEASGVVLPCPVTAYGGTGDARTPAAHLDAWREMTTGAFRVRTFAGGHFYLAQQRTALLEDISASLAPVLTHATQKASA